MNSSTCEESDRETSCWSLRSAKCLLPRLFKQPAGTRQCPATSVNSQDDEEAALLPNEEC